MTVNELGYAQSSLAEIAKRAETSKSVISYHFDGKEELLEQVVEQAGLASHPAAELAATCGRDRERAEGVAADHHIPHVHTDYREMIASGPSTPWLS